MSSRHSSDGSPPRYDSWDDWDDDFQSPRHSHSRRPSRLKKIAIWSGILAILLFLAIIGSDIALYVGTQGDTSVGDRSKGIQVCIIQSEAFTSHVFVSSSDKAGNWSHTRDLLLSGDLLTIQGEMITSILPLSANGFNAISITGSYAEPKFKSNVTSTSYLLNSEDQLFTLSQKPFISWLIHGSRMSRTISLSTNIKTKTVTLYTLIPTSNGLVLQPEPLKLSSCDNLPA